MNLELTQQEVEALKDLLKERVLELRAEIRKADDSEFKEKLRQEKEIFKSILKKLGEEID
ncbi:MAG: hypothetical protein ABIM45_07705 [candidate division WOR-3 bacterium]|jgi:hypothetical protein